jgi:hypothetical protein
LRFFFSDLHAQSASGCTNTQLAISELADEIERFSSRLFQREADRVIANRAFDHRAHVRSRAEKSICGHQSLECLVRALKIVSLHVEIDAAQAVIEIGEHGA